MSDTNPVGQLLWIGLKGLTLTKAEKAFLEEADPGGITLFARNLKTPSQTARLISQIQKHCPTPPFIALDEEGGRVSRFLKLGWKFPSALKVAGTGNPNNAKKHGALAGEALRMLGFNVDFAPVVDLSPPDVKNGIADRAYSTDPKIMTRYARAFLDGLASKNIAGCLKHFPGLGATRFDSHLVLPTARRSRKKLLEEDLYPYHKLHRLTPFVMTGHAHYPALEKKKLPASFSKKTIEGLLRERVKFKGLALSDDIAMKALSSHWSVKTILERTLAAGCDMVLVCEPSQVEEAWLALTRLKEKGELAEKLLRIKRAKKNFPLHSPNYSSDWRRRYEKRLKQFNCSAEL